MRVHPLVEGVVDTYLAAIDAEAVGGLTMGADPIVSNVATASAWLAWVSATLRSRSACLTVEMTFALDSPTR